MSDKPFEFRPSGSIEFEAIEPEVLVKQRETEGVPEENIDRDPLSINFGRAKGTKPSGAERMLSSAAMDWFIAFGADARPKALCDQYAHVANRLAGEWSQRAQARRSVEALIADARWGKPGFPALVRDELQRLLARLDAAH